MPPPPPFSIGCVEPDYNLQNTAGDFMKNSFKYSEAMLCHDVRSDAKLEDLFTPSKRSIYF